MFSFGSAGFRLQFSEVRQTLLFMISHTKPGYLLGETDRRDLVENLIRKIIDKMMKML